VVGGLGPHASDRSRLRSVSEGDVQLRHHVVHGYRRAYRIAGEGPALLLVHGIGDSSATWVDLMPGLARRYTVIAPDLLGHGGSDKPRADYSVAAYANGMRDLLGVLGIDRATLVGHSFGGGVAMQFAYQFPERTERLVLVSAGGVGREVNPVLRAVSLPGADLLLSALRLPGMRWGTGLFAELIRRLDTDLGQDAAELLNMVDALPDATSRSAFIRTLRAVVDWRGQVVTMLDRCYLAQGMPTMLLWGSRERGAGGARARRTCRDAGQSPGDLRGCGPLSVPCRPGAFSGAGRGLHRDDAVGRLEYGAVAAVPAGRARDRG
jgi:pimeloyl-ACP methyl ester carboxylesterase